MKKGSFLMRTGLLLILAALFLTGYNKWDEARAGKKSDQILQKMDQAVLEQSSEDGDTDDVPDYIQNPDMEMPTVEIDGQRYIGKLEIPVIGLSLPVMESWSYQQLRIAPCRYLGSSYSDDLIIAGHNYKRHFGHLKNLAINDQVIFTDVEGNRFVYQVTDMEVLGKTEVEEMRSGEWDLTLFTCTYGGQTRVTVRCEKSY